VEKKRTLLSVVKQKQGKKNTPLEELREKIGREVDMLISCQKQRRRNPMKTLHSDKVWLTTGGKTKRKIGKWRKKNAGFQWLQRSKGDGGQEENKMRTAKEKQGSEIDAEKLATTAQPRECLSGDKAHPERYSQRKRMFGWEYLNLHPVNLDRVGGS